MYRKKWEGNSASLDSLKGEISRLQAIMYKIADASGSLTDPLVIEISQVIDQRVLEYQRMMRDKGTYKKKTISMSL